MINQIVKIDIKELERYTKDLYESIQGKKGVIIKKQGNLSLYEDAWLIKFGKDALNKYKKTHSGKWSNADRMEWWIESKDFKKEAIQ